MDSSISDLNDLPLISPRPPRGLLASPKDRRASPRIEVELVCEERLGDAKRVRVTWDLSTFGVSTRQGKRHPVGTRVQLALSLPDQPGNPVRVLAEVVASDQASGMRLAFRNPPADAVRRLHRFLTARVEK